MDARMIRKEMDVTPRMKFQFKIQAFQTEAAESVVRVFAGQSNTGVTKYRRERNGN